MDAPEEDAQGGGKTLPIRTKSCNHSGEIVRGDKSSSSSKPKSDPKPRAGPKPKADPKTDTTGSLSSTQPPGGSKSDALPDFILQRNKLFDELKKVHDAEILEREHSVITVVLDLGLDKDGIPRAAMPVAAKKWESTPGSFLKHLDKDITSDVVVAKVDGKQLWDLDRPLEYDCRVSYIPFVSAEGRNVFWHSSAHALGEAAECQFHCLLSHGPPVEQGFFYDMAIPEG